MKFEIKIDLSGVGANPPQKIGTVEVISKVLNVSKTYTLWSNRIAEPDAQNSGMNDVLREAVESAVIKALNSLRIDVI